VSYVTNQGELYMSIAFSNGGNRDAAVLRVEPALWNADRKPEPAWTPLVDKVHPNSRVTSPKTALVIKLGREPLSARACTDRHRRECGRSGQ
jgi:hypothetical protein